MGFLCKKRVKNKLNKSGKYQWPGETECNLDHLKWNSN